MGPAFGKARQVFCPAQPAKGKDGPERALLLRAAVLRVGGWDMSSLKKYPGKLPQTC
ncbi:MAG: hypothetical protein NT074_02605 [Methanomicrobiales archaeon]|nr:hypothetical protein [Methanomicrobiales archaeon]